ncbi:MAG: DUF1330 domain-containing protein [Anaerolineales bacterium]
MTAYIILDIEVTDPEGYKEYIKLGPLTVALYGGKYIARGGKSENIEGDWQPRRIVMLEFPSVEQAKAWINSPEYAPGRELRHKYATSKAIVVDGL